MNLSSYLPLFVDLMLKSTVLLLLAWLAARRWRRASAANRHMVWLVAFGGLALLPLTTTLIARAPKWPVDPSAMVVLKMAPEWGKGSAAGSTFRNAADESPARTKRAWAVPAWRDGLVLVWLGVGAGLLGLRMAGAGRLRFLHRRSRPVRVGRMADLCGRIAAGYGIGRAVELRVSDECPVAMTWGTLRPVVMLPAEALAWSDERLALVLRHELAHVRRGDCLARLCCQVAGAFYWPNPLVWLAGRWLRLAQEQACDDCVLTSGIAAETYALELTTAARSLTGRRWAGAAVAMAEPSTLESRIIGIVSEGRDRRGLHRSTVVMTLLIAAMILSGCRAVQVRAEEKPSPQHAADAKRPQVKIMAKLVEIPRTTAEAELDFLKTADRRGANPALIAGFLTSEQMAALFSKLQKIKGVDILSRPTVLMPSGYPGLIQVGQEMRYPTHWNKDEATSKWVPSDFETRNVGVELRMIPQVAADGTIELNVVCTLTEFEGFLPLGTVHSGKTEGASTTEAAPDYYSEPCKPIFTVRSMQAIVPRLLSGQTAVLRGIEWKEVSSSRTDTITGRELESSINSTDVSLLIFVTADISANSPPPNTATAAR
jgi:beta-lactamase regulating signal transducer with metallopeptidase domain